MKKLLIGTLLLSSISLFAQNIQAQNKVQPQNQSQAQTQAQNQGVYNSKVANPFVFCSLPKPCKKWCQPWRSIWEQICPAGQLNPQEAQIHEKARQDLLKTNPELVANTMTSESFKAELGKANLSAFSEDDQYVKEVSEWIKYQGNQITNGKKVSQVWCEQGIGNPVGNQQLRQMAYNDIVKKNQKIVELISNGTFPPKDTKPWYEFKGDLTQQCNINDR